MGYPFIFMLLFLFWVWALIDVIATDSSLARNLPKLVWVLLVIFLFDIGALVWLLLGRPEGAGFWPGGAIRGTGRQQPGYRGTSPYRTAPEPRYLGDYEVTDRRSAELDRELEEWERRRREDRGDDAPGA
jgi:hypothetical protein